MPGDMLDMVFDYLQVEIRSLRRDQRRQTVNTERAEYTDSITAYSFADLPTVGLADGSTYITMVWVSNGRKPGEGAGAGTGVLAVWQQSSGTWKRVGDYTDVVV